VQHIASLLGISLLFSVVGCGGSNNNGSSGSSGGGGSNALVPSLTSIAPSAAVVGTGSMQLVVYGSNFDSSAQIQWNGSALQTQCVDSNLITTACSRVTSPP
jgi:hypothetical protein